MKMDTKLQRGQISAERVMTPFFSIVTITRNDAWSLTKTVRSVFRQSFKDYEYIVVDGASTDGTSGLIRFWQVSGLINHCVSEPDSGVYNAMNKGTRLASGRYVCFLNAGDVFAHDGVLEEVHERLSRSDEDGVLGWGELGAQIWASWIGNEAFKLASLGFCHQSLYVKRELVLKSPFDERPFKTDSDTLQLARLYRSGARIPIEPRILATRGMEPGISANLERTKASILNTLVEEYPPLTQEAASNIIAFRRQCADPDSICALLEQAGAPLRTHLAIMVLDTLFLRQSSKLTADQIDKLYMRAQDALLEDDPEFLQTALAGLEQAQEIRLQALEARSSRMKEAADANKKFGEQETTRIAKLRTTRLSVQRRKFVVSLTSFPARIGTLHFVIQSLLEQTCVPEEIHVWLGADEIPNRNWLPRALLDFEKRGLHVHFAPRTFHQYDKFMHNGALNRDRPFVIVDDDVIYPPSSMESLLSAHQTHPNAVIANRCHQMALKEDGDIAPYSSWKREVQVGSPSLTAFPTGAGGVLYPPGFLSDQAVIDVERVLSLAPYADDIWLKVCALASGVPTMSTPLSKGSDWYLRYTPTMTAGALHATNVDLGLNDLQMSRALQWLSGVRPTWRRELLKDCMEYVA
jgi:hypothetical protein